MQLQKGQKQKLDEQTTLNQQRIDIKIDNTFPIDISCFVLNDKEKLYSDEHMIFYNQKRSPHGEVEIVSEDNGMSFLIDLKKLPSNVSKLVFTAAIDNNYQQKMKDLGNIEFKMGELNFSVSGRDFLEEKAIILTEIYKKEEVWRINAVGQGFNGGLDILLKSYGGEVKEETTATSALEAPKKISLDKIFEQKAPKLINLAKEAKISLEKNNLIHVKARAAFILDASGSMITQYRTGQVQKVVERMFPLGVHFDDNNELETFSFADKAEKLNNVSFDNYKTFIQDEAGGWESWMKRLDSRYNNEPEVMRKIIKYFTGLDAPSMNEFKEKEKQTITVESKGWFGRKKEVVTQVNTDTENFAPFITSKEPILILFVSDGGVAKDEEIEYLMRWSSSLPIFWQFVGIGGNNYGALEKLDDLKNRFLDNADFFSIDNLQQLTEAQLYDKMLTEFPSWLKKAHEKGIIDDYMDAHIAATKNKFRI